MSSSASTAWVSGSPKRQLNSTTAGPAEVIARPGVEQAGERAAPPRPARRQRVRRSSSTMSRGQLVGQPRQRRIRAHATGVGPGVAVADALEVLRGQQRHHGLAVDDAEQRHLGTVEEGLEQHRMPASSRLGGVRAGGVAVGGHDDALARGQPVVLDHPGLVAGAAGRTGPARRPDAPGCRRSRCARCARPAAAITSLANAFDPSIRAASFDGPKQAMPAARTASATPRTSGHLGSDDRRGRRRASRASCTTASPEVTSTACCSAIAAVPAFPARRSGRRPRGLAARRAATHVHGHRIRSRGRAQMPTLIAQRPSATDANSHKSAPGNAIPRLLAEAGP